MNAFPARLHILLARHSAVVIRRGPSQHVCVLGWDRRNDTFQIGQWLKGRIYERRCDLSPDGEYLIYFAMNGRWQSETKGSWTAISRAPYLKALALFSKGDCWQGCYWDEHELIGCDGETLRYPTWEWTDYDGQSLLYAEHGCLYRCPLDDIVEPQRATLLYDFNPLTFEAREAGY